MSPEGFTAVAPDMVGTMAGEAVPGNNWLPPATPQLENAAAISTTPTDAVPSAPTPTPDANPAPNPGVSTFDKTTGNWTPGAESFPEGPKTQFNDPSAASIMPDQSTGAPLTVPPNPVTGAMAPGIIGSALDGIGEFATSSPLATYGLIQAGGALVQGMFNPVTPAQIAAMNAQAAQNRAAAAIAQQQASNMAGGMPIANLKPVPTAKVTGAPALTGIINTAPTGAGASVTGAPANV
jgi:hypothetical protein